MNKKIAITNLIYTGVFILLIAFDRLTKQLAIKYLVKSVAGTGVFQTQEIEIIPNVFSLHYLENRGAAWGLFQNALWLFIVITIVVVVAMLYFYSRLPFERRYHLLRVSIIVLSAGAIGNFIDRIVWRYVVDFLYFKLIDFPVFNVADCYVCVAAVLLLYCLLFKYKDEDFFGKRNRAD